MMMKKKGGLPSCPVAQAALAGGLFLKTTALHPSKLQRITTFSTRIELILFLSPLENVCVGEY
jgi:hypothetical protein